MSTTDEPVESPQPEEPQPEQPKEGDVPNPVPPSADPEAPATEDDEGGDS